MTNEESIFAEALTKGSGAMRAAYLDAACAGDDALRRGVEALLLAHERPRGVLESPPAGADVTSEIPSSSVGIGCSIGRYKLLEQIGAGGMGVVYMAEQLRPIRRKVALKIIKPGMDSGQVIARFEAERQALTMMDHPNIATVLDAGTTDTGRPYFVMELVKGVPITDYCDQARLTTRQRLELFVPVCQAVQHAHQKGVIHRDLKPGNVLVTLLDDKPVPKVIDFGIAKATGQVLTDRTLFTNYAQMLGTPLYMSPEQAQISGVDVDTRSDVYSLGVLLYELLTGTTPFDQQRLREAAYDEMRRIIREEEPPNPSTRISTMGAQIAAVSAQRHTEPKKLGQLVRGELDWIVMKAMEKDRGRRYETAVGLGRDVERYLEDEAVQACPPSARYRFRKFARRNKGPLVAASTLALVLVLGSVVSTWQALRARRAEGLAETRLAAEQEALTRALAAETLAQSRFEAEKQARQSAVAETAKATAISYLLQEMLLTARPNTEAGPEYTVRQMLDDFSARMGDKLKGQPDTELALRMTILNVYKSLALPKQAKPHAQAALELRRRLHGPQDVQVADSLMDLAWIVRMDGDAAGAEAHARDAVAMYQKQNADAKQMLAALSGLQQFLIRQSKYADAEAVGQEALKVARQAGENTVGTLQALSTIKRVTGSPAEAEKLSGEALGLQRGTYQLLEHATNLSVQGRHAEAEPLLHEALEHLRKSHFDELHPTVVDVKFRLADLLRDRGDKAGMTALLKPLLINLDRGIAQSPDDLVARMRRANALRDLGDFDKAIKEYSQVLSRKPEHTARQYRDRVYLMRGKFDEAEQYFSGEIALDPNRAGAWSGRAFSRFHLQQWAAAIADFSKALELDPNVHSSWFHRGHAYMNLGDWDKAAADFGKATERWPSHTDSWYQRAVAHAQLGEPAKAVPYLRQAVAQDSRYGAWMKTEPRLDPLRAHDEFKKLSADFDATEGKSVKAEAATREAIRLEPGEPGRHRSLGELFLRRGQLPEAADAYAESIRLGPDVHESHYGLSLSYARRGQWEKAKASLRRCVEVSPRHHQSLLQWACLSLYTDDQESYRRACQMLVEHFADTTQLNIAERTAKTCSLGPGALDDFDPVVKLADKAVTGTEKDGLFRFFVLAKGLVELRAGRHASARDWVGRFGPKAGGNEYDATAFSVTALAHLALGQRDEASTALKEAQRIIEAKSPDPANGRPYGNDWHDWLHARILFREAEKMLAAPAPTP